MPQTMPANLSKGALLAGLDELLTTGAETAEVVDIENGEERVKDAEEKHVKDVEEKNAKQERKKIDSIIKYRINSTNKNDDYLY